VDEVDADYAKENKIEEWVATFAEKLSANAQAMRSNYTNERLTAFTGASAGDEYLCRAQSGDCSSLLQHIFKAQSYYGSKLAAAAETLFYQRGCLYHRVFLGAVEIVADGLKEVDAFVAQSTILREGLGARFKVSCFLSDRLYALSVCTRVCVCVCVCVC